MAEQEPVRKIVTIWNLLNLQDGQVLANDDIIAFEGVAQVSVDDCADWHFLAAKIFAEYRQHAANPVTLEQAMSGNPVLTPDKCWPGRDVLFYSMANDGSFRRYSLEDNWVEENISQNLNGIVLMIPRNHKCAVILAQQVIDHIDIEQLDDWMEFATAIHEVYTRHVGAQVLNQYPDTPINPLSCCPGARVTYWGDLDGQQFFVGYLQAGGVNIDNWFIVRISIRKVLITPY